MQILIRTAVALLSTNHINMRLFLIYNLLDWPFKTVSRIRGKTMGPQLVNIKIYVLIGVFINMIWLKSELINNN